jgi:hypothetical protein
VAGRIALAVARKARIEVEKVEITTDFGNFQRNLGFAYFIAIIGTGVVLVLCFGEVDHVGTLVAASVVVQIG